MKISKMLESTVVSIMEIYSKRIKFVLNIEQTITFLADGYINLTFVLQNKDLIAPAGHNLAFNNFLLDC